MATIKEIFTLPRFSDLKLVTPNIRSLDTEIKSVEVFETPDIEHFIPEGVEIPESIIAYLESDVVHNDQYEGLGAFAN